MGDRRGHAVEGLDGGVDGIRPRRQVPSAGRGPLFGRRILALVARHIEIGEVMERVPKPGWPSLDLMTACSKFDDLEKNNTLRVLRSSPNTCGTRDNGRPSIAAPAAKIN